MVAAAFLFASAATATAEPFVIEVTDVAPLMDERIKQPVIAFKMSPASTKRFAEFTTENVGRKIDIRIDGKTVMSPVIREPITGGSGQISGNFTLDEANTVAMLLRSGALPGRLSVADQQVVQPSADAAKH